MTGAVSRRAFVTGAMATGALGAGAGLVGCTAQGADASPRFLPFFGRHQPGITALPVPKLGLMAAFAVQSRDRAELARMLEALTDEARALMSGDPPVRRDPAYPPVDSGLLGAEPPADDLSVVVSVGASLFDDRFGLADRRPTELVTMQFLANDRLDPARSHGDLLLSLEAGHADTLQFALRQLMRRTRGDLVLRWLTDGYSRGAGDAGGGTARNLLGFKDGTANLDPADDGLLDRHTWVAAGDPEPAWTTGGSYHVVRLIRMLVEFWDRTPLAEQEALIGRHKDTGAPLGRGTETDLPDFGGDPQGEITPLTAHIRLANPRTPETRQNLIFRRGFSFARGFDAAGRLDQGLAFVCYQRSLARGFLAVQERLTGEPLEEYIRPEGGGFFFALPGVPSPDRFLGDALLG